MPQLNLRLDSDVISKFKTIASENKLKKKDLFIAILERYEREESNCNLDLYLDRISSYYIKKIYELYEIEGKLSGTFDPVIREKLIDQVKSIERLMRYEGYKFEAEEARFVFKGGVDAKANSDKSR